jgi:16S rRNA (cytidine1402-2'-O)-methyltransferase
LLLVLILAATPIGNLGDASPRLRELLGSCEYLAAEDTRVIKQLCGALGIKLHAKLFSLHEHNESERIESLVELARSKDLVVVSDAGMPTVSDPGFQLVRLATAEDVEISIIPGPSAVLAALAVSGLPTDRFSFEGFLPRKQGDRKRVFTEFQSERRTMIFFEAPHRILESLEDAASVFSPDRKASVSRELTKKFEHTERGSLQDLIEWAKTEPKGEMVLVIAGAEPTSADPESLAALALQMASEGMRLKEAAGELAKAHSVSSSAIYDAALRLKA